MRIKTFTGRGVGFLSPIDPRGRRALTLVEVMVAMVVFVMVLLGVLGLSTFANVTAASTVYMTVATQAAQGIVEQIRGTPYGSLIRCINDPSANPLTLIYYRAPVISGKTAVAGDVEKQAIIVNSNKQVALAGVFVNAVLDSSKKPISSVKMNYSVKVNLTPTLSSAGSEGVAVEVVYTYDVPRFGGFRSMTGVHRTFVPNVSVE